MEFTVACGGKHKYEKYIYADMAIKKKKRIKLPSSVKKAVLSPYKCSYCKYWHVGKTSKK